MIDKKPDAYSYVRFSTSAQEGGDSLRRQREASAKYANDNNLSLADLHLEDRGISAFKGKNSSDGALSSFLRAVEDGTVKPGSYLLVEQLDRLSRADVWTAFSQLSGIVNAGINVVTVSDGKVYSKENAANNFADLIIAISVMIRANDESLSKSRRLGAAWKNKRDNASTKKLTSMCPNWMMLSDDRKSFTLIDDHVETIERIYSMAINGMGSRVIVRALNSEKVPTYGRSEEWAESTVKKILKSRAVLGEYQPHKKIDGKRIPDGEPIPDYYPAIIPVETYNLAQSAIRSRKISGAGRKGQGMSNIFSGLVRCGYCGGTMRYVDKGQPPRGSKYLTCVNGQNGQGCSATHWRYDFFEKSVLSYVRRLDLQSLIAGAKQISEREEIRNRITATTESITDATTKIDGYLVKVETNPDLEEFMLARVAALGKQVKQLREELDTYKLKFANLGSDDSVSDEQMAELLNLLQSGQGDRFALSGRVRSMVSRIDMYQNGQILSSRGTAIVEASDIDEGDKAAIIAHMNNHSSDPWANPHFKISFADGNTQAVIPSPDDPSKIIVSVQTGEDGHFITEHVKWTR